MAKAIRLTNENWETRARKLSGLKEMLIQGITELPELVLNSDRAGAPHIVHFSCPGMKAEVILHMLEEEGMFVSTQSACSSKQRKPSRVLLAIGKDTETASTGLRISLGEEHTEEHINKLLKSLGKVLKQLHQLKGETS